MNDLGVVIVAVTVIAAVLFLAQTAWNEEKSLEIQESRYVKPKRKNKKYTISADGEFTEDYEVESPDESDYEKNVKEGIRIAEKIGLLGDDLKELNDQFDRIDTHEEFERVRMLYELKLAEIEQRYRKRMEEYVNSHARPDFIYKEINEGKHGRSN